MRLSLLPLLALLALLLPAGAARADYTFEFTNSSGTTASAFNVGVGQTVQINVYLAQTNGTTGLSSSGLDAGGVKLLFDQTIATVPNTSAITPNSAFDTSSKSVGTGSASLNVNQIISGPVVAPTSGTDANRILIGTFTFTGVAAGSTLTVTADPHPDPNVHDNVLHDGTVLDSMIVNSSASITVTAVPEPGSMILCGVAVAGFGAGVLRRRFLSKKEPLAPVAG